MKLVVCCVRDVRASTYGNPFFVPSVGAAERQFADEINRAAEDNLLYKHPEDFELYELGSYDASTCVFDIHERPLQRLEGRSCVKPPAPLRAAS